MTSFVWKNVARRLGFQACLVVLLAAGFAGRARAQEPSKDSRIYVVTHVDSVPNEVPTALKLLRQYASDTHKEKGNLRVEVLVQISRPNHFSIVEVWQDQQDYDAHVADAHTKEFREQIQPVLGSPFDERLHKLLE
jgi:quinol monooxygenase YgiN